jgi:hypothetical protein
MSLDLRLVEKGRGQPRDALAQEGKVHVALANHHAAELEEHGWSAADTAAFEGQVSALEAAVGSQADAYGEAGSSTAAEGEALGAAKELIRKLRNALPRALRESPDAGVAMAAFLVGEELGRSTPKISAYLARIRPAVVKLDPPLSKYFKSSKASVQLDQVKQALDDADTAQELARKNAPDHTQALYEVMGRVLEGIEDMNRAGRSAFDGDAVTAAKFNKDLLMRGRKSTKKAASGDAGAPDVPPAPPGGNAPLSPASPPS